jgi:hypothetical protein
MNKYKKYKERFFKQDVFREKESENIFSSMNLTKTWLTLGALGEERDVFQEPVLTVSEHVKEMYEIVKEEGSLKYERRKERQKSYQLY